MAVRRICHNKNYPDTLMSSKVVSRKEIGKTGNLNVGEQVSPETSCVFGILHTLDGVQLYKKITVNQPLQHTFRETVHNL